VDAFAETLARFERGEITADEWRAFRLVNGSYPQRQEADAHMLRVKVPQGVLAAAQLEALAEAAERWSRGFAHVTTRQNLQMHFLKLHDVEKAMELLARAGLTTREACGNSVRNVTACPFAGVARDEAFDVTPYAEAFTRHFLRHPLSASLPRKFKVAFEGCPEDHAFAAINDIGWRAIEREGASGRRERGFRVTVGGGTATLCAAGGVLVDFLPAVDVLVLAEAIVRAYHRLGDYEHRKRNRLKYLIRSLGWDGWKAAVASEVEAVRAEGGVPLPFDPESPPVEPPPGPVEAAGVEPREIASRVRSEPPRGPGLAPIVRVLLDPADGDRRRWAATNVRAQRQAGYSIATVTLPLGDVTSAQLRALASLARAHGDGEVRTTHDQNLVLRWVPDAAVEALYRGLAAAGLGQGGARTAADVTSCPGAESCRLAVTHSRGLGRILAEHLASRPEIVARAGELDLKISGCPNGCGQHHVAGIGFQGSVRQVDGRPVPQYFVSVGGGLDTAGARFGRLVAKVPARRVADATVRLLEHAARERQVGETTRACLQRADVAALRALLADLEAFDPARAAEEDYVDTGGEEESALGSGRA
jgi:sulfite reductase (NADPH) hemoprotein beta-component